MCLSELLILTLFTTIMFELYKTRVIRVVLFRAVMDTLRKDKVYLCIDAVLIHIYVFCF